MAEKELSKRHFSINGAMSLEVTYFDNGDGQVFENQRLIMNSNFDDASFNLSGSILTPRHLRLLAEDLELAAAMETRALAVSLKAKERVRKVSEKKASGKKRKA